VNTGEYGITFLIVMANAAVAGVVIERAWRGAIVAGIILTLVHLSGAVALFADRGGSVVRLAYEWYEAVLGGMVCIVAGVGGVWAVLRR